MTVQTVKADICIIGGGFAALSTLAHLVRGADKPFRVAIVAEENFANLGTAYSTPRDEHLLNVRAIQMGMFDDDHEHFFNWAKAGSPHDYMPRKLYGAYLKDNLAQSRKDAAAKGIAIDIIHDKAVDIDGTRISCAQHVVEAAQIVLAVGNSFVPSTASRYVDHPWHFDFDTLKGKKGSVAVVGTGLTAVDVIISLHTAGYEGDIICYSGNGHLPCPHPLDYDAAQVPHMTAAQFSGKRLSGMMKAVRDAIRSLPPDTHWSNVFHAIRPFTQEVWQMLSTHDRSRAISKYLWLWNTHRHRYAAPLAAIVAQLQDSGRLQLRRGRVVSAKEDAQAVTLNVRSRYGEITAAYPYAFKCIGPSFRIEANAFLKKLVDKGVVQAHATGYGLAVQDDYRAGDNIYVLGSALTGELLETIAVPEIRMAAAAVSKSLLQNLK